MQRRSSVYTPPPAPPRFCPLCGSRVAQTATRCLVCGTDLNRSADRLARRPRRIYPHPFILGLLAVLMGLGLFFTLIGTGTLPMPQAVVDLFDTPTPTLTFTPLPTPTASITPSTTPTGTPTLEPPIRYTVQDGDSCLLIALINEVSVDSIIMLNGLDPNCTIAVGNTILVPRPSPTPLLSGTAAAVATGGPRGGTVLPYPTYVVLAGDSCLGITGQFDVTLDDFMNVNGLVDCSVIQEGQIVYIPVLQTQPPSATPTLAATLTPTPPAARPAPALVAPTLGQSFPASASITLSWTAVGPLGTAEFYRVTVEDLTCNCNRRYITATTLTTLGVPPSLRPDEATAHIFSWTVELVKQIGVTSDGQATYEAIGATSAVGTFTWTGTAP